MLIHIEVQSQPDPAFSERMYVYRYHRPLASLALLGDDQPAWQPDTYVQELWGCRLHFTFPGVKLLAYQDRQAGLETGTNPFALVVQAHLAALQTRGATARRRADKWTLVRRLYARGWTREEMMALYHFVDRVLQLPQELEEELWQEIVRYSRGGPADGVSEHRQAYRDVARLA